MLIGMLNWLVTIGRIDVAYATSSMSRFTACPRKGHLERVMKIYGYLKKYSNRRIVIDSSDPKIEGDAEAMDVDYTVVFKDQYPDAVEEIDEKVPEPRVDEMEIIAFVDSDHAHDKVTKRSITGSVIFVGKTPVQYPNLCSG